MGEFELIRQLQEITGFKATDDCHVLEPVSENRVISVDSLVEDVHFTTESFSAEDIGFKALAVALSDLAAMGAVPECALIALQIPKSLDTRFVQAVYRGVAELASETGTRITGGNISSASKISLAVTVIGKCKKPVTRNANASVAKLYVASNSGLGGAALGLRDESGRARQRRPRPMISEGVEIARHALAMIDISDGLVQDAMHLAEDSGGVIEINSGSVPLFDGATLDDALYGGEDYALLYLAKESSDGIEIGTFSKAGKIEVLVDGKKASGGFDHLG